MHGAFVRCAPGGSEIGRFEMNSGTGAEIEWNDAGRKVRETPYVEGRRHGTETLYDKSGARTSERTYEHGDLRLERTFDKTGRLRTLSGSRHGRRHGPSRIWSAAGALLRDGVYNFGLAWNGRCFVNPRWSSWDTTISTFKAGKEIGPREKPPKPATTQPANAVE
jgi:hypothetical protein